MLLGDDDPPGAAVLLIDRAFGWQRPGSSLEHRVSMRLRRGATVLNTLPRSGRARDGGASYHGGFDDRLGLRRPDLQRRLLRAAGSSSGRFGYERRHLYLLDLASKIGPPASPTAT